MADKSPFPALWLKQARGSTSHHRAGLGGKQPDSGFTPHGSSLMTGGRKAIGKAGPRRLAASGPLGDRAVSPRPRRELGVDAMPLSPSAVSCSALCEKLTRRPHYGKSRGLAALEALGKETGDPHSPPPPQAIA